MNNRQIVLKKVKVHNLKEVDLELQPFELIVFTGVSGSGKSSLAFDTIFVEGQRRYIESLSHSARRNLHEMPKPEAQLISGLSPTIAVEQKTIHKTPRSTIGTITGIYDYFRVLFARIGIAHCPISGEVVTAQSKEKILQKLSNIEPNKKIIVLAPFAKDKKGAFKDEFLEITKKGFVRVRIDGEIFDLSEAPVLDPKKAHDIEIVIDRITTSKESEQRLFEAATSALEVGEGQFSLLDLDTNEEKLFSQHAYSKKSNISYGPLSPKDFSFNHPAGMCDKCQGLGDVFEFDIEKIINPNLSISEDCCQIAGHYNTVRYKNIYDNLAKLYDFDVTTPWKDLSEKAKKVLLYGTEKKWTRMLFVHLRKKIKWHELIRWQGILFEAHKRLNEAKSEIYKKRIQEMMTHMICPDCRGVKIKKYPAATEIDDKKIYELTALPISELNDFFKKIKLSSEDLLISKDLISEIKKKLQFLIDVGLHYLTLDRTSPTLSGGESQRVKLASLIGCGLSGATYVLDEPSIGLHPEDHHKLIDTLIALKNVGNTIIVVEHDKDTIEAADTIVDVGPLAGKKGGEIVAKGTLQDIMSNERSLTGQYLSNKLEIAVPKNKRKPSGKKITITNATHHNLKNIDVSFPLECFICVTGVSGSGKSSLISDTLFPALSNELMRSKIKPGNFDKIKGIENITKIIFVDQSPIGRSSRSNAATYIKLYDDIRNFYAELNLSKMKGFLPGHFSFNVKEGSCPYCKGLGKVRIDMDFMEDEWTTCMQCKGKRFDPEILEIKYKNKSIFDVLEMDIDEAIIFFDSIFPIRRKLEVLQRVGLGYLPLGQSATTLSGGEAQRVKLAKELSKQSMGSTFYILDEPTTGLHFEDMKKLLAILHELVDKKNTVLVIEHNMDFVKTADWIIDMGPKGGKEGGEIINSDTPENLSKTNSATGRALKKALKFIMPKAIKKKEELSPPKFIEIENAHHNNLKNINIKIPHNKISIFTGPSGSGKSSLAFDTIFAEGQLRYMEALPPYARQFLKQMPRSDVGKVDNLFPCIAIEQKGHSLNPRSTVGTITEIYDNLRLLYAHLGTAYCPETNEPIKTISKEYVVERILSFKDEKIQILAPIELASNESFEDLIDRLNRQGYLRIRLNKKYYELDEKITFTKGLKNEIELVIDRIKVENSIKSRLFEAIDTASKISDGIILIAKENEDIKFNLSFAVESTGKSYPPITPQSFSFNSEAGMCLECQGIGYIFGSTIFTERSTLKLNIIDLFYELIGDDDDSIHLLEEYFYSKKIDPYIAMKDLSPKDLNLLIFGDKNEYKTKEGFSFKYRGINATLQDVAKHANHLIREPLIPLMEERTCHSCNGQRLNPLARNVKINNVSITDLCSFPLDKALNFISSIKLDKAKEKLLKDVLKEIKENLSFLIEIGLSYISLDRSAPTLSGGEMQRIRLARQLGSKLTSCIYILDEPTVGLHSYNAHLLINALKKLKDNNNTLILVEHDPLIIKEADYIFDFGPKAGKEGGKIIAEGTFSEILKNQKSLTGQYLKEKKKALPLTQRKDISNKKLKILNGQLHNLKNIDVDFPISAMTTITGVSGSGKSTLIHYILKKALSLGLKQKSDKIDLSYAQVEGILNFDKVIYLDQSPIGQTSRADVSTYSDIMPFIRKHYASLKLAKAKGLYPRHFSYNHLKGMCRNCWGMGYKTIDLQYLPSVKVECDVCHGKRLNPISLEVKYKDKSIGDILDYTIDQAKEFFSVIPHIVKKLDILIEVGLSYLKLGQEIATLSGGEAQRIRLCKELSKRSTGKTLYLFDEPSVGLNNTDIDKLLKIFYKLTDKKNTLILIEHNLDIIASSDYIIDVGPGAGEKGGEIVAIGRIEDIVNVEQSHTGKYLKEYL